MPLSVRPRFCWECHDAMLLELVPERPGFPRVLLCHDVAPHIDTRSPANLPSCGQTSTSVLKLDGRCSLDGRYSDAKYRRPGATVKPQAGYGSVGKGAIKAIWRRRRGHRAPSVRGS